MDQIHAPEFEQLVVNLCKRPGMYVGVPSYVAVCAYLDGFDAGRDHGPLMGLHQWLVVRYGNGDNLHWPGLIRHLFPGGVDSSDEEAIRDLGQVLGEFFECRRSQGVTKVFHEYAKWLLRRSWYQGPLRRNG